MYKEEVKKTNSLNLEIFTEFFKLPVDYCGDNNQQSHSAVLWAVGPLY